VLQVLFVSACGAFAWIANAQTYQLSPAPNGSKTPQADAGKTSSSDQQLGWGSNIQNARLARAAQLALQRGDHAQAYEYAQRAAQAAPNDPQLWFLLGYAARLDAKYQQSVDAFQRGLQLSPSSADGMSGLAQTYNLMGRTAEAERLLKQSTSSDPRRRDDLVLLGNLYLRSKDYADAIDSLEKAERLQPGARSELLLSLCYQQTKQMDQANHYLQLAERRAPNDPDVQRSLAGYYREAGKYAEAIAELKSIRNPKPDVVAELAYTYELNSDLSSAAHYYSQAANAQPGDLAMQLSAAQAQIAVGSVDGAGSFIKRAASLDANDYRVHAIRGQVAQLKDQDAEAIKEYSAAVANLPQSPAEGPLYGIQLHMDLMELYRKSSDGEAAQRQLQTALTEIGSVDGSGSGREQFLRLRALIRMNAGDLNGALADVNDALAINATSRDDLQLSGDILMKMGRIEDALTAYKKILAAEPTNRFALTAAGYASRAAGRDEDAEKYFRRLAQAAPSLYVPYLALGDLYTTRHDYKAAQASYNKGYSIAPNNALIVAGGMNAAIESHNLALAGVWMNRVAEPMLSEPEVLREKERYLSFDGKYQESAAVGEQAIKVLPDDRDVVVYLGYDLLRLDRYNELLALTEKYRDVLPKEADIPLLEGYVHKHQGLKEQAKDDFTEALKRDPNVVTAYVNRGYMLNDLHKPQAAAADFRAAITREPGDGEAHLGLAYSSLDMREPHIALEQADLAERALGDSRDVHVIRATAYSRQDMLAKAVSEYRRALKFTPDDGDLHLALGSVFLSEREYHEAIDELDTAQKLMPDNADTYVLLARSYASIDDRNRAMQNIQLAEQHIQSMPPEGKSSVFISAGQALSLLGDQKAAMDQYRQALEVPNSDRIGVRLAIGQLMVQQNHASDAERQIALGWMEAAAGETEQPTGSQFIAAADVFRSVHEYELSQSYLQRAKLAGAPDAEVRIGLADNDLAMGNTARAEAELSAAKAGTDSAADYQYLLGEANVYRQEHKNAEALTAFAQASNAAGDDQTVERNMLQVGADEGLRVTPSISLLADVSVQPVFEDTTVYVLDSKLDTTFPVPSSDTSLLPPPRSSIQTQSTAAYHLHLVKFPTIGGFFQVRNAQGQISVPATNSIVSRNTLDYVFNTGVNPVAHVGGNVLVFNAGIQGTVRRDTESPIQMNQNLFRTFAYVSSSSFFNALSFSGYVIHESGPFTESKLHSRTLTAALDFRVGAPWDKTALVTGWGMNDQSFSPVKYEDYSTASYVGIERKFFERVNIRAIIEDLRSWRTVGVNSGIAQNLRPAGSIDLSPKHNWEIQASSAYSSNRGFHVYDALQNGVSVSYARPFHRMFNDVPGGVLLEYPIRFSAGIQQETFMNFSGAHSEEFRPYVEISVF
jgi:tetratricopeptide (TPR) repeat protein